MDAKKLADQRFERIMKAVRHEKPDRTPLMLNGNIALLKYVDPRGTHGQIIREPVESVRKIVSGMGKLDNVDHLSGAAMWPGAMGAIWFSKTKLPGRELGEDEPWQIDERAFMTREDYDLILDKGWDWYANDVLFNRLGYKEEDMMYSMQVGMQINKLIEDAGFPAAQYESGIMYQSPVDKLTSGRGTVGFFRDIRQIPDKLQAVLGVIVEEELGKLAMMLKTAKPGTFSMNTPAIRCTCDYVSEEIFEKFIWPTMYKAADMILEAGLNILFHNDSNWDDFLHFYKRFPKNRCIYDSDGQTDIYKVKEILGGTMCLTGNVSSSLLSLGTPEEVYKFCRKQIEDMGDGYILSSSCSLPANTKPENLDAMNAAAAG